MSEWILVNSFVENLINSFRDYQTEWLKSHNDIELDADTERLILRFIADTADRYIEEAKG